MHRFNTIFSTGALVLLLALLVLSQSGKGKAFALYRATLAAPDAPVAVEVSPQAISAAVFAIEVATGSYSHGQAVVEESTLRMHEDISVALAADKLALVLLRNFYSTSIYNAQTSLTPTFADAVFARDIALPKVGEVPSQLLSIIPQMNLYNPLSPVADVGAAAQASFIESLREGVSVNKEASVLLLKRLTSSSHVVVEMAAENLAVGSSAAAGVVLRDDTSFSDTVSLHILQAKGKAALMFDPMLQVLTHANEILLSRVRLVLPDVSLEVQALFEKGTAKARSLLNLKMPTIFSGSENAGAVAVSRSTSIFNSFSSYLSAGAALFSFKSKQNVKSPRPEVGTKLYPYDWAAPGQQGTK